MKKIYAFAIISCATLAGSFSANGVHSAKATELNVERTVSFTRSCAPWDGQAYRLDFNLPNDPDFPLAHFQGNIWGNGITNLQNRTAFTIDGPEGSVDSTGDAYVSGPNRQGVFVHAKFKSMEVPNAANKATSDGFGTWIIEIPMPPPSTKTYYYLISPVLDEAQALCG